MKKIAYVLVFLSLAGFASGCAQKSESEKLEDDMKKMGKDMKKSADKAFNT